MRSCVDCRCPYMVNFPALSCSQLGRATNAGISGQTALYGPARPLSPQSTLAADPSADIGLAPSSRSSDGGKKAGAALDILLEVSFAVAQSSCAQLIIDHDQAQARSRLQQDRSGPGRFQARRDSTTPCACLFTTDTLRQLIRLGPTSPVATTPAGDTNHARRPDRSRSARTSITANVAPDFCSSC